MEASLFPLGDDGSGDEDFDALLSVSLLLAFGTSSVPALPPLSFGAFSIVAEECTAASELPLVVFPKANGRCACEYGTPGAPYTASGANEGG